MNVILVMVQTADGKTTLWHEPKVYGWSSPEDQKHFRQLIASHNLVVMGKNTYISVKDYIKLSPEIRRIVLTRNPSAFASDSVQGQLEFTAESPGALVARLSEEGYQDMLLVGGSRINMAFLEQKLITECLLTIEPRFTGNGNSLFAPADVDITLSLLDIKKLNTQGTLLVHYKVLYEHPTA